MILNHRRIEDTIHPFMHIEGICQTKCIHIDGCLIEEDCNLLRGQWDGPCILGTLCDDNCPSLEKK